MSRFVDLHLMVADIRAHVRTTGRRVELDDNPLARDLGYKDSVDGASWVISLVACKESLAARPDPVLASCMGNLAARLAMVNVLSP